MKRKEQACLPRRNRSEALCYTIQFYQMPTRISVGGQRKQPPTPGYLLVVYGDNSYIFGQSDPLANVWVDGTSYLNFMPYALNFSNILHEIRMKLENCKSDTTVCIRDSTLQFEYLKFLIHSIVEIGFKSCTLSEQRLTQKSLVPSCPNPSYLSNTLTPHKQQDI